ncbi:MAG: 2-amino-4-hydroxy-6-hydroxymethyldihydropteridine diphosphokinase [Prevotellaceae bacterium]|jgi:2-amino-4-hydroxy-6-hydroxymethyldihydropteridine diphosphokinase|nr:2-amino-4-hydroxy-6-hydroxymethyldihydropteridine diphosphokinase [Prevotellaceae bacterium]
MLYHLLLGSNLGDRQRLLAQACELMEQAGVRVEKRSSVHETKPWGFEAEQDFLNMAVQVQSSLPPHELLRATQRIEQQLGRVRHAAQQGYTSRTIDIDILLCGSQIIATPTLSIPHPRLHLRRFALAPLAEIAPELRHPVLGKTVREMLENSE